MERKDAFYVLFYSFAAAFALFFLGLGKNALFMLPLSLAGTAFLEKTEKAHYAAGAIFLALAFAVYFNKSMVYITPLFAASLLFLLFPFILIEVRKRARK